MLDRPATHQYVRRYAQLRNIGSTQQPDPKGRQIDVLSVLSFASANDAEDYLTTAKHRTIEENEATFIGLARSECWLSYSSWGVKRR